MTASWLLPQHGDKVILTFGKKKFLDECRAFLLELD